MTELVLRPLADAFLQVGVFVAVLVVAFGLARHRYGDRVTDALQRRARVAPVIGAALGAVPGCGAEIILATLYVRRKVSFGTVVAALVATMGDAAWVLIAAAPRVALQLHLLLFGLGVVTGYVVDRCGLAPHRTVPVRPVASSTRPVPVAGRPTLPALPTPGLALHAAAAVPVAFLLLAGAGFGLSLPVMFQLLDPANVAGALGGLDAYLLVGLAGTALATVVFLVGRSRLADDTVETACADSLGAVLRHAAQEASFVTVWVGAAFIAWGLVQGASGFDGSQLPLLGLAGVLAGALVGLVPGCAVQIVFTGVYLAGGMPLSTLAANAVSQDGDALLPLLALDRGAALTATAVTTLPAVLAGSALLLLA